jgi:exodeoxyribonuclease V gamma subunit
VWGAGASFDRLLAAGPGDGEGWAGETTRFGALACRLWAPVRDAERFG